MKVITIKLLNQITSGIIEVEVSNRPLKCLRIPRRMINNSENKERLQIPSLYFLFGKNKKAYIGKTGGFSGRKADLNKKDFWGEVLLFSSLKVSELNLKYLEHLAITQARKAGIFDLSENKQQPQEGKQVNEKEKTLSHEFFEDVKVITSLLGYKLFDVPNFDIPSLKKKHSPYHKNKKRTSVRGRCKKIVPYSGKEHILYCKNEKGTNATGFYNDQGFTILKGSQICKKATPSYQGKDRGLYLNKKFCVEHESYFELRKNITVSSPSAAASFCLGVPVSGQIAWKDEKNTK